MEIKFFVPFETAKALKEKGFDEECDYYYSELGMTCFYHTTVSNSDLLRKQFAAPTYHEAVDWLESKGIRVFAHYYPMIQEWVYGIADSDSEPWENNTDLYRNRWQALNAGILKALEMI